MKGVIMPTTKKVVPTPPPVALPTDTKKTKLYWIITDDNQFTEVSEQDIIDHPAEYIGKPMFEKPKDEYEIIVMIKKKGNK